MKRLLLNLVVVAAAIAMIGVVGGAWGAAPAAAHDVGLQGKTGTGDYKECLASGYEGEGAGTATTPTLHHHKVDGTDGAAPTAATISNPACVVVASDGFFDSDQFVFVLAVSVAVLGVVVLNPLAQALLGALLWPPFVGCRRLVRQTRSSSSSAVMREELAREKAARERAEAELLAAQRSAWNLAAPSRDDGMTRKANDGDAGPRTATRRTTRL